MGLKKKWHSQSAAPKFLLYTGTADDLPKSYADWSEDDQSEDRSEECRESEQEVAREQR